MNVFRKQSRVDAILCKSSRYVIYPSGANSAQNVLKSIFFVDSNCVNFGQRVLTWSLPYLFTRKIGQLQSTRIRGVSRAGGGSVAFGALCTVDCR